MEDDLAVPRLVVVVDGLVGLVQPSSTEENEVRPPDVAWPKKGNRFSINDGLFVISG